MIIQNAIDFAFIYSFIFKLEFCCLYYILYFFILNSKLQIAYITLNYEWKRNLRRNVTDFPVFLNAKFPILSLKTTIISFH